MKCSHCESEVKARGMCGKHYQVWAKYGSADAWKPNGERRATRIPWILNVAMAWESDSCLIWPFSLKGGRRTEDAYPALGKSYAHVKLCELTHGKRPTPSHEAEHICGNKLCMNKRHVQWALHKANCARRTEHGTQTIGEKHPGAVLTEKDVLEIRQSKARGVDLAKQYGVTPSAICLARKGKSWRHL